MTTDSLGFKGHLTHRGNLRTSRYGWLRLTPMYSIHLVETLLEEDVGGGGRVLDPFCGTGTTALVCAERGVPCDTTDINPFLIWLAAAKTHAYASDEIELAREAAETVAASAANASGGREWVPPLSNIDKWWDAPVLDSLSRAWAELRRLEPNLPNPAAWLLVVAFLRASIKTAHVSFGHQSMSFKQNGNGGQLRMDAEGGVDIVVQEWRTAVELVASAASSPIVEEPREILCDARALTTELEPESYASVITSPPYCNRMSYIRELRPYMYWTGFLADARSAGDLDWLAIGGTWGIATSNVARWEPETPVGVPFDGFDAMITAVAAGQNPSAKLLSRYIAKYFHDTTLHAGELFNVVEPGGRIHYIVGNSKFYDVMVPVEQIYASIFEAAGFEDAQIETLRKRTSKKELFEFLVSARKP